MSSLHLKNIMNLPSLNGAERLFQHLSSYQNEGFTLYSPGTYKPAIPTLTLPSLGWPEKDIWRI